MRAPEQRPPAGREALPRGRHAASPEVVRASQRQRLLDAMAEAVAERGLARASVADVIARAGVSRKTFYEHFADREECFLASFEAAVSAVIASIGSAIDGAGDEPLAGARAGSARYLEWLAANPAYAWTFVIEVLASGPAGLRARAAVRERFADLIGAGYEATRLRGVPLSARPPHVFRACAGAIDELVVDHLLNHGAATVTSILENVLDVEFALLLGPPRPAEGW